MIKARTILSLCAALALVLAAGACRPDGGEDTTGDAGDAGDAGDPRLVEFSVADDPTVGFVIWFDVGSVDDPPGKEGLATLTGALIDGGATESNSYEDILDKLYPLASGYSVRVDKEMTTVSGRTHRDNLDRYLPLLTDAYLRPAFTPEDFERVKSDQLNYLEKTLRYASDEELAKAALIGFIFDDTPYEHPIEGTVEGLRAITLDDVKAFYRAHYTRDNAVVGLGGGYDGGLRDRVLATLDQLPAPPESTPAEPVVEPAAFEGRHVLLVDKPDADASISFGFPIDVHRGSRDFYALWIANSWLGEHRNSSSHLYKVIRETRGMNYGDYSYIEAFPEGGFRQMPPTGVGRDHQIFEIWIRTLPNEQAVFATRAALRELERLVAEGMSEEEFELTRSFLSKYHLHFAETTQERLGYAVDDRFYGIEGDGHLERFGQMISEITREEVNAAIKKHLQPANIKFAIVTGDAEGLKKQLTSGDPTPMSYGSPQSEEILAEDKEIAAYPLGIPAENVRIVKVDDIFER